MIPRTGKPRANLISPFMFHLYKCNSCLTENEEETYEAALVMDRFGFSDKGKLGNSDLDSDDPESLQNLVVATPAKKKRKLAHQGGTLTPQKKATRNVEKAEHKNAFRVYEESVAG